jgi:predicted transposase YdaD
VVKKADIGGKRLIGLSPDAWVQWVTGQPDLVAQEIIGSDFQWISRENDVLVKVFSPTYGEFLVLTELQLRYLGTMPERMRVYIALAEEKYGLPVYAVLINILPPAQNVIIPSHFERNFMGQQSRQDYQVINLWEVETEMVFEKNLVTLMPFVPILKDGDDEVLVRRAVQLLQQDPQLNELESLLAFFASFVLETEVVAQILRWDMAVLRESPWYQEILLQGEQRGITLGEQRGAQREAVTLSLRQLARRLRLDSLPDTFRILDFQTLADLETWLQGN